MDYLNSDRAAVPQRSMHLSKFSRAHLLLQLDVLGVNLPVSVMIICSKQTLVSIPCSVSPLICCAHDVAAASASEHPVTWHSSTIDAFIKEALVAVKAFVCEDFGDLQISADGAQAVSARNALILCTMRFGSISKVLTKRNPKYYRISECCAPQSAWMRHCSCTLLKDHMQKVTSPILPNRQGVPAELSVRNPPRHRFRRSKPLDPVQQAWRGVENEYRKISWGTKGCRRTSPSQFFCTRVISNASVSGPASSPRPNRVSVVSMKTCGKCQDRSGAEASQQCHDEALQLGMTTIKLHGGHQGNEMQLGQFV